MSSATLGILAAVLLGTVALITAIATYRKVKPEATKLITDSALIAVNLANCQRDAMSAELKELKESFTRQMQRMEDDLEDQYQKNLKMATELKILQDEMDRLRSIIQVLNAQVKAFGGTPFGEA